MEEAKSNSGGSEQAEEEGAGGAERAGMTVEDDGPRVHTSPEEGHPAGEGERSDRDMGGPTSPDDPPEEDATGGATGSRPDRGFEPQGTDGSQGG